MSRALTRCGLGLFLAVAVLGCGHRSDRSRAVEGSPTVIRRGLSGEPASLDPAAVPDSFSSQVVEDLYEGLTVESPSGSALPGVASSWEVDPTGTQYRFHLRADARWSNGQAVRARDFVAAWRRVVDPKRASPVADNLRILAGATAILAGAAPPETLGVSAPSDDVLVVNLEHPAAYLPQVLAHPAASPIYSDDAARAHGPHGWISNGAYVLTKWQPGTAIELSRNAQYWDNTHVHVVRIEYQFAADDNSQYARYRAGQLDLTDVVPANQLATLRAERSSELVIAPILGTAYYGLNVSNGTLGPKVMLRQALAMAIDRKQLVETLGFGQLGAYGLVPPGTWNYDTQSFPWASENDEERIAQARRLYAQAGFSPAAPLHLRLLFNSSAAIKRTAIAIAAMWKQTLGVDTEFTEEEYRVFLQTRHDKSRWDVVRLGWDADYNDASNFLDIFRAHSPNNDMGYVNPRFDALLDRAAVMTDLAQRKQLLEDAERVALDDYPIVPLYYFVSKRLVKPYIRGVKPSALNLVPSKMLSIVQHE